MFHIRLFLLLPNLFAPCFVYTELSLKSQKSRYSREFYPFWRKNIWVYEEVAHLACWALCLLVKGRDLDRSRKVKLRYWNILIYVKQKGKLFFSCDVPCRKVGKDRSGFRCSLKIHHIV